MQGEEKIKEIIEILGELEEEGSVPKNVKNKIELTMTALAEKTDLSIRINKALHELEEIADDPNLQSYTRTQVWNIVSILEKIS